MGQSVMLCPAAGTQVLFEFGKPIFLRVQVLVVGEVAAKGSKDEVREGLDLVPLFCVAPLREHLAVWAQRLMNLLADGLRLVLLNSLSLHTSKVWLH